MKHISKILVANGYKTDSPIERIVVYELLEYENLEFETQYEVPPYRLDIAIPKYKLCLEIDGVEFHSKPWQVTRDKRRDEYLKKKGWKIERIPAWFCQRYPMAAVIKILRFVPDIEKEPRYLQGKTLMLTWFARELANEGEIEQSRKIVEAICEGII